ncbi:type II toxin -antitoxin system TacA 1-like antitoxin [Pseudaminobacter sp. NGMCC 1.201702]|uniref:type II toxin -antitoxin system TacA 1-like antitoxin n=1 Tax=Pseudaminobacter sp. NGMCC 1.201702 TaxID=3391825 RepID=UPI0039EF998B
MNGSVTRLLTTAFGATTTSKRDRWDAFVQEAARRAIEEHQRLNLNVRDSRAFIEVLISLPPVNDRACAMRLRATVGSSASETWQYIREKP